MKSNYIYFLLVTTLLVTYKSASQEIQKVEVYESNQNLTGEHVNVIATDHIKLFYTPGQSDFRYTFTYLGLIPTQHFLHGRLGKKDYPTVDLNPVLPENREQINQRPDKQWAVGSTTGELSVSDVGSASYNIPIQVPPGTNGVAPQISLVYNSNSGNGIAGWGWNISGLSSITRIGKDKYHDGVYEKIQFSPIDKLTLDGNRLVAVSGSEGSLNAIYATEVGNTLRIYPHGRENDGYTWFLVEGINGSKNEYGNSNTSRPQSEKGVISWLLNKTTDNSGNYILYDYGENTGETFIKSISYTGNDEAGLAPYAKVEFIYERRGDKNTAYFSGVEINQTVILKEIIVKCNEQIVHKYVLDYISDVGYNQLYRIIEFGENDQRYNSTIFEYYAQDNVERKSILTLQDQYIPELDGVSTADIADYFGDFNGDHITDRLFVRVPGGIDCDGKASSWYMQFGKYFGSEDAGGFVPNTEYVRENNYQFVDPPNGCFQFQSAPRIVCQSKLLLNQVQVIDINGDSYDDLIIPYYEVHYDFGGSIPANGDSYEKLKIRIDTSDGTKLNYANDFTVIQTKIPFEFGGGYGQCPIYIDYIIRDENLLLGDFDQDGSLELIVHAKQFDIYTHPFSSCAREYSSEHYHNFYYCDLSDINENGKGFIKKNINSSLIFQSLEEDENWQDINAKSLSINYNGDNKTDIMFITDNANDRGYYEYDKPTNRLIKINNNKLDQLSARFFYYPGDFNGDGFTDLLYFKKTFGDVWRIRYGTDGNLSDESAISDFNFARPYPYNNDDPQNEYYKDVPFVVDMNGDGKTDIIWFTYNGTSSNDPSIYHIFMSYGKDKFNHKVELFTDPLWHLSQKFILHPGYAYNRPTPIIDFNGDGYLDFYNPRWSTSTNQYTNYVLTLNFQDNGLHLKSIYDGFNNKTSISYEPLSKGVNGNGEAQPYRKGSSATYPLLDIGGGGYVVTEVNKFMANEFLNPKSQAKYKYEEGLIHLEGKGFLGFQTTKQIIPELDGQNETSITTNKSINLDKYIFLNSYTHIINGDFESHKNIETTNNIYELPFSRYFVYTKNVSISDNLDAPKYSNSEYFVDEWGNSLTEVVTLGTTTSPRMSITKSNEYRDITGLNWCANNKLYKSTITQDHADDPNPNYTRSIEYGYYGAEDKYRLKNEISDPSKAGKVEITYNYDIFGNVLKASAKQFVDIQLEDRYIDFIYDPLGRFIKFKTNSLGHTESYEINSKNGNLTNYTDIGGSKIEYQYDDFGRKLKENIPALNNSYTNVQLRWSDIGDPVGTSYITELSGSDMPNTSTYYDSWGRDIVSQKNSSFPEKTIRIKKEYKYDGRIAKVYTAYNAADYPLDNPPKYLEYSYDLYKRPDKIIDINNLSGVNTETSFTYDHDTKYVHTSDGATSSSKFDAGGFQIESIDPGGDKILYYYSNNGQIKEGKLMFGPGGYDASTFIEYDEYGRQHKLIDLDAGTQILDYNSFGELIKQTSPKGYTSVEYDILGRPIKKKVYDNSNSNSTDYIYNYCNSGPNVEEIESITSSNNINYRYFYDNLGRVEKTIDEIQGKIFVNEYSYYDNGSLKTIKYPSGVIVKYDYNSMGDFQKLLRIDNNPSGYPIFEISLIDEMGRLRECKLTNGILTTKYDYDNQDYLTKIKTYQTSNISNRIQELDYDYWRAADQNGMLKKRTDVINGQTEEFLYDNLYRLKSYTTTNNLGQSLTKSMTYYDNGSKKTQTSVGTYFYNSDPAHRDEFEFPGHAIKGLSQVSEEKPNHSITYTPFNSISEIEEGGKKASFTYGEDEQRAKMEYRVNDILQYTKYYLGDYELIEYSDNTSKELTYLDGGCVVVKQRDNQEKTLFVHTDNLGSIQSITDIYGNLITNAEFSFDPWGKLRHKDNWLIKYDNETQQDAFDIIGRGFTGHEHMSEFGLINMNGRVYDQHLGQFIQPDNYIQYPGFTQSYNRYSYCLNNPVNFTDPSGELFGFDDAAMCAFVLYSYTAASIASNTIATWNNYGWKAGMGTLVTSVAMQVGSYAVSSAANKIAENIIGRMKEMFSSGTSSSGNLLSDQTVSAAPNSRIGVEIGGGESTSAFNLDDFLQNLDPNNRVPAVGAAIGYFAQGANDAFCDNLNGIGKFVTDSKYRNNSINSSINNTVSTFNFLTSRPLHESLILTELHVYRTVKDWNYYDWGYASGEVIINVGESYVTGLGVSKVVGSVVKMVKPRKVFGSFTVYQGVDEAGTIRYIGITERDPIIRWGEHMKAKGTGKELLRYKTVKKANNLTRIEARTLEQRLINKYGLQKNGGQLLNKINSISPIYWGQYGITP